MAQRPDHVARVEQFKVPLPLEQCWAYYRELVPQQTEVLALNADVQVLKRYGLSGRHFLELRRIIITPATHGFLFNPSETPIIRAFPYSFNYPIPRIWPGMTSEPPPSVAIRGTKRLGFTRTSGAVSESSPAHLHNQIEQQRQQDGDAPLHRPGTQYQSRQRAAYGSQLYHLQ